MNWGDLKIIIADCQKLSNADEHFSNIIEAGMALEKKGESSYSAAMSKYKEALALNYNNKCAQTEINGLNSKINSTVANYKRRAKIFIDAGNKATAKSLLQKALKLRTNDTAAKQMLKNL